METTYIVNLEFIGKKEIELKEHILKFFSNCKNLCVSDSLASFEVNVPGQDSINDLENALFYTLEGGEIGLCSKLERKNEEK